PRMKGTPDVAPPEGAGTVIVSALLCALSMGAISRRVGSVRGDRLHRRGRGRAGGQAQAVPGNGDGVPPAFLNRPRQSMALAPNTCRHLTCTPSTSKPCLVSVNTPSWPSRYAYSIVSIVLGSAAPNQVLSLASSRRGSLIEIGRAHV